jgi:hypothetical protein
MCGDGGEIQMNTHPRDMRARIWRAVLSATDQEIRDGLDFYPGAYGLCRMFASVFHHTIPHLTSSHVAGIYAALSPMNGWDTNVANVVDVLRWGSQGSGSCGIPYILPQVNTPNPNLQKALRIVQGEMPLDVLRGSKVRAFYRGISEPDDTTPIAVDRHLLTLACRVDHLPSTRKSTLSRMASDKDLYAKVEAAYTYIGNREGLGNRIASICWFVQRRVIQGQCLILQPSSIVCCGRPMHVKSREKRYTCGVCHRSVSFSTLIPRHILDGFNLSYLNNRRTIHLGVGHPYANSGGWQYVNRYVVMKELGRRIGTDEHAHHIDHNKLNDVRDGSNYQLLLAETHGRHHRYVADLAGYRDAKGRFMEHVETIAL